MARSKGKIVARELTFDLTDAEYGALGKKAGQQRTALLLINQKLEDAKKQAKVDAEKAEGELMATLAVLASGKENRTVECEEIKDFEAGKVEYYWQGVCMAERPLNYDERQGEMVMS